MRLVQIACGGFSNDFGLHSYRLFGLDEEGQVWVFDDGAWTPSAQRKEPQWVTVEEFFS